MQNSNFEKSPNIKTVIQSPIEGTQAPEIVSSPVTKQNQELRPKAGLRGFVETIPGKITVGASAALAAGALVFGGIKIGEGFSSDEAKPGTSNSIEEEQSIPPEAQDFITYYGDLYTNPVATWYAESAAENADSLQSYLINTSYITDYNYESLMFQEGQVSPLGFNVETLDPEATVDVKTSIDQFNGSLPDLNRLINLLAKNPTSDRIDVIKDEFSKYTGAGNSSSSGLVDILAEVTQKFGSNSNYSINPGVKGEYGDKSEDSTIFAYDTPIIDAADKDGRVTAFNNPVNLSISIETYDDKGNVTQQNYVVEDVQFSVERNVNNDPYNAGYIGLGASK